MDSPHWTRWRLLIFSATAMVLAWISTRSHAQDNLPRSQDDTTLTQFDASQTQDQLAPFREDSVRSAALPGFVLPAPVVVSDDDFLVASGSPTVALPDVGSMQDPFLSSGYDTGFFIKSASPDSSPFVLRANLQSQFRFTNFRPEELEWTDASGTVRSILERNDFDINRGRIIFSGSAIDPDLNYYVNLDYATLGGDRVTILLAWINYRFNRAFDLHFGKGKVPGSREWLLTSMATQAPERSMATTFFRPSITTGVWARGEPYDNIHYQAAIGNGFNTAAAGFRELDTNFVYSANLWWEPLGEFGLLYSDWQWSASPVVRWGGSLTSSRQGGSQVGSSVPEDTFIRLSDGTDLTTVGALAPGVTVTDYSVTLATLDAGYKYRGCSLHGEYFLRWLSDIRGTGPIPEDRRNLFDHGIMMTGGHFLVPQIWEIYLRSSHVFGAFGDGNEFAAGLNWFVKGRQNWRFAFDTAYIDRSPTEQIRTGYEVGASGMLYRAQLQVTF